jgi:glutamyl-tRNA reductase
MYCISISFRKTPLDIRQQFAFREDEQIAFLSALVQKNIITGGIILSTCNRSEIYITGNCVDMGSVENELSGQKHIDIETIKKYCLYYQETGAVRHLYKVVCGLDSMILGEDEIFHQVKEAYAWSDKQGFTNSELNIIFQGAFNCAKLSKTETKMSNTPVSIGTITANMVYDYLHTGMTSENTSYCHSTENVNGSADEYDTENNCSIAGTLVIGATGKIGSIVAKDMAAKGLRVLGTRRSRNRDAGHIEEQNHSLEWWDFDKRYDVIPQVSVIVSATTSPHYTITKEEFEKYAGNRHYMLIDLAVPYDIDRSLQELDNVTLYDIDYFRNLSQENSNIKLGEKEKVKQILDECVEEVLKKLYVRDFQEKMSGRNGEQWFQKMVYYLRDVLDSEQLKNVLEKIEFNEK